MASWQTISTNSTSKLFFSNNVQPLAFLIKSHTVKIWPLQHLEQPQPFQENTRPWRPRITSLQSEKSTERLIVIGYKNKFQINWQKMCNHLPLCQRLIDIYSSLIGLYSLHCFVLHSVLTCMREESANEWYRNTVKNFFHWICQPKRWKTPYCRARWYRNTASLLHSHSLGCHATLPPKKRPLTSEQHSFHAINQSPLPFHFQERFCAKFAFWNLSNQGMFFIFVSHRGRCHK